LGNQKKDIYKCPKSVFPKRSWKKEKYVIIHFWKKRSKNNNFPKGLKELLKDQIEKYMYSI
jgi:hypothetical protein